MGLDEKLLRMGKEASGVMDVEEDHLLGASAGIVELDAISEGRIEIEHDAADLLAGHLLVDNDRGDVIGSDFGDIARV